MDMVDWVQILDEADCISHGTNKLGKGMNPIIFPPARYLSYTLPNGWVWHKLFFKVGLGAGL